MQRAVKVAFVFDCKCDTPSWIGSLCLICSRILLSLSGFPNGTRIKCFKWKYVFFNHRNPANTGIRQFMQLRSSYVENLFKELCCEMQSHGGDTQTKQVSTCTMSSVLTDLIEGCTWDSPDIFSPPLVKKGNGKERQKLQKFTFESDQINVVFVFSDSPWPGDQLTGNVFTDDLSTCLLKQNIHVFWLCRSHYSASLKRVFKVIIPTTGSIIELSSFLDPFSFSTSLPQFLQLSVGGLQGDGCGIQLPTSIRTRESNNSYWCYFQEDTEHFWLSNKGHVICIIQVEPLCKSPFSKSLLTSIKQCTYKSDEGSEAYETSHQGQEECSIYVNHAVIVGVIRQCDVPYSLMQPCLSFSSIGLTIPSSNLGKSLQLQQSPERVLPTPRKISKEYQNMCGNLMCNRLLLLLEIKGFGGDSGMCVLQPLSSVMCSVSVLQPQHTALLTSLLLNHHMIKTLFSSSDHENCDNPLRCEMFTSESLLQWFPFVQNHGIPISSLKHLKKLQMTGKNRDMKRKSIQKLLNVVSSHPQNSKEKNEVLIKADQVNTTDDTGVTLDCVATTIEEVLEIVRVSYNQQVEHTVECSILQEWVSSYMLKIQQKLYREHLFSTVYKSILLTPEQLENKYANETQQDKMTEYQLQVLLRLELYHICSSHINEAEFLVLASQVTSLLRKISLIAKPSFLGHCMKEVIIPRYSTSCKRVLLIVYEDLMLPLPAELVGKSISSPYILSVAESSESTTTQVNSECHLPQENPTVLPATAAIRRLRRRASFQDQRQITVPAQRHKVKKEDVGDVTGFTRNKDFHGFGNSSNEPKKVCRTLFNRTMSLTTDIGCKRHRVEEDSSTTSKRNRGDFVVKETPVKKQVDDYRRYKLQRLRSKMDGSISEQVAVIEESPQRSFYSSKLPAVTTSFQRISKKRPSPTAMKALLQGAIIHESDKPTTTISSCRSTCSTSALRVLTYEEEDPLMQGQQACGKSPQSSLLLSSNLPYSAPYPATDSEPFVGGESASMVAFALSTPTKDDPLTFQNILEQ